MKSLFLFLLLISFIVFAGFKPLQKKYLPVYISLTDSSSFRSEILLNLKAAFNARKIKTVSKDEMMVYIKNEASPIFEDYIRNGGDVGDWEKQKIYLDAHMIYVATSLTISLKVSADGIINDTVKWHCFPAPINFEDPPKRNWRFIILDSTNSNSLLQITQSIADSVIASNVLIKE
jgi:hypothetical protein